MRPLARTLALLVVALPAAAQQFPSRPITLICPYPPGGATDIHLRRVAELAAKPLGQPVVIENRPGGGGMIGPGGMAQTARPDGYTISQLPMTAFRIPHMQKVSWDPLRDFTYIIGLSGYRYGVVVRADTPFTSFSDLLGYAKSNPGKMAYATSGTGSTQHLAMEDVAKKSGAEFLHVPYKGSTEATQAVLGGHVMALASSSGWGRLVDSGQLKLLVTFSAQRAKRWPTVPTANDLGLEMVYDSPYGVVGPRNLQPGVVKTLHDAFKQAIFDPEHQKVLDQLDQELWYRSSEDYARYARETFPKERALVQRLGMLVQ